MTDRDAMHARYHRQIELAEAQERAATARTPTFVPIEDAPTDGSLQVVFAPEREGLPPILCVARYHESAGYCVDELRVVTHYLPGVDLAWIERVQHAFNDCEIHPGHLEETACALCFTEVAQESSRMEARIAGLLIRNLELEGRLFAAGQPKAVAATLLAANDWSFYYGALVGLDAWLRTPGNVSHEDAVDACARAVRNLAERIRTLAGQ